MDRETLLKKIKKCLALGKSSNEHEAAAALRQAQKLMEMHGLTEEDVGQTEYVHAVVVTDYEWPDPMGRNPGRGVKIPLIIKAVCNLIGHAIGVEKVYEPFKKGNYDMFAVRYFGPRARVMMAEHAHTVVYRAVGRAWRAYLKDNPWIKGRAGGRAGFYMGWCRGVVDKVAAMVPTDEEKRGTELAKSRHYGRELQLERKGERTLYGNTLEAGAKASADFDMHRPLHESRLRIGRD